MTNIENYLKYRNEIITCDTCGRTGSRYVSDVQMFHSEGQRYYGSPLRQGMGSIIVKGTVCSPCVRVQAQDKVRVLSATYLPASMIREPRVNEMP